MQEAVIPNQTGTQAAEPIIRAEKIEKYYAQPSQNRIQVISATDLEIVPGEILALLGPSGSGKSTMLRILTGLSTPTAGQVYWHQQPIAGAEINVSIVFQSFALFPWLTVLENVEAPLQARGVTPGARRERSMKMLDTVGLDGFEGAYPKELSGGMKQRVGFARALVVEPEVLFMDEPFSALDVLTAENLRSELLELWVNKAMPTKAVFLVTHNIEITGMVTASGGAWNASVMAEYSHVKDRTLETIGLGAQIDAATDSGRFPILLLATILISLMVVTMNRLVWRRLYRLAETRYKLEG